MHGLERTLTTSIVIGTVLTDVCVGRAVRVSRRLGLGPGQVLRLTFFPRFAAWPARR